MGSRVVPLADRLWARVDRTGDCWLWLGAKDLKGYGRIHIGGRKMALTHRVAYEVTVGSIPEGLQLDHLCRTPACVRPTHLEPVTPGENTRRGLVPLIAGANMRAKTHCPRGHPYDEVNTVLNTYGRRVCRICRKAASNRNNKKRRSRVGG